MPRWAWFALAVALLAFWWVAGSDDAPAPVGADGAPVACPLPPAFRADDNPRQSPVDGIAAFRLGDAQVTPLAGFSLEARILSREDYARGVEARYSPTDLALGWGPMAAPGMAERLDVTQGGRWYRYRWGSEGPPLPVPTIVRSSANMHLVPADATVAEAIGRARAGDLVRMHGWLVKIDRDDGWRWRSSLTRTDTGGGSCELVYVCAFEAR
jgi:hypothetical protein